MANSTKSPESLSDGLTYPCKQVGCKAKPFAQLAGLQRHETENHDMHNGRKQLHCPVATCSRHPKGSKPFTRTSNLQDHMRRRHKLEFSESAERMPSDRLESDYHHSEDREDSSVKFIFELYLQLSKKIERLEREVEELKALV
jgi:hypothetical protein